MTRIIFVMLVVLLGLFVPAHAQAGDVQILCPPNPDPLPAFPSAPFGSYISVQNWRVGENNPLQMRQDTSAGAFLSAPFTLPNGSSYFRPLVLSPDRKYVLFEPFFDVSGILVANTFTGETANMALSLEENTYLADIEEITVTERLNRLSWESADVIAIRFEEPIFSYGYDAVTAVRRIRVEENPLRLTDLGRTPITYQEYPPTGLGYESYSDEVAYSPDGRFQVQSDFGYVFFEDVSARATDGYYIRLYDVATGQLAFALDSLPERQFRKPPLWAPDGQTFVLEYEYDYSNRSFAIFRATTNGFVEDGRWAEILNNALGDFKVRNPILDPTSTLLVLDVFADETYLGVYNLSTNAMTLVCYPDPIKPDYLRDYSSDRPIWFADTSYFGWYRSLANFITFDLNSGEVYSPLSVSRTRFVGWLPTNDPLPGFTAVNTTPTPCVVEKPRLTPTLPQIEGKIVLCLSPVIRYPRRGSRTDGLSLPTVPHHAHLRRVCVHRSCT